MHCGRQLGIPGVVPALDRMLVADYLLVNEDRHQNNFGAVRNAETLEWIDWDTLKGIELEFAELVADSPFIDAARCDAICHAIRTRVEMLQRIALMRKGRGFAVSCANDVRQDQAYSGNKQ